MIALTDIVVIIAISLPLAELNAETAKRLDRARDVVVYCWDGL